LKNPTLAPTGGGGGGQHHASSDNGGERIMVYSCDHDTEGEVTLTMPHGKKLDHMGIQVKFFGRIDMVRLVVDLVLYIFVLGVESVPVL
jgi:hypothetical protein